ncbi:ATP-binding protein [uncultured Idiomarina sp.]|uniref:ATP-binding protein n=1 Tax=uncultured Idiomarina sp. TaxID=352961 RepID=UPI0032B25B59|tara:strand:- start:2038 stop:5055 length:3018 start_codon:yes stop_codon:yes gene_type:complete
MSASSNRKSVSFKAQARTIDHLGKGQIADAPTAVSELWKNSYDAYARDVALHLFDGDIKCGAIIDNGCGMSFDQLSESWLTIGTATKSKKKLLPYEDRFGLAERSTQGEKGIGRLSTAFLAPVTLIITKKRDSKFSAALIDWRLFENTYLGLNDIKVPLEEFDDPNSLPDICNSLQQDMLNNLGLDPSTESDEFIRGAWARFSEDEKEAFENRKNPKSNDEFIPTEQKVRELCESFNFVDGYIASWKPMLDKVDKLDGEGHGTALFLIDLNRDLALLTNRGDLNRESTEYQDIRRDLVDTLRAFVDPFNRESSEKSIDFHYEISACDKNGWTNGNHIEILKYTDVFNYVELEKLEHKVIGNIDDKGWFRGTITAFGEVHPNVVIPCRSPGMDAVTKTGAFDVELGTFEQLLANSTHDDIEHDFFMEQAEKYSGLMIFRDGLRVLPYGRVDNDFFEIEERRATHAGRHFWSARRLFGRISLDQRENQNLKDKAGREGFIINQSARQLKTLIKNLLLNLADNYFGGRSDIRQEKKKVWDEERKKKKKAQKSSTKATKKAFIEAVEEKLPKLSTQLEITRELHQELVSGIDISLHHLDSLVSKIDKLEARKSELKAPNKPSRMAPNLEEKYREYRDLFAELSELLLTCREKLNQAEVELQHLTPIESAERKFKSGESALNKVLNRYENAVENSLSLLSKQWRKEAVSDRAKYGELALPILDEVSNDSDTVRVLNSLDSVYRSLEDDFVYKYEAFLQAVSKLEQGIDLDSAFSMAEEERTQAEQEINQIRSLAQLGISFEIVAHELHSQERSVTRSLNSMSSSAKQEIGFKNAIRAHRQFTNYLKFLTPLKLSGYQNRETITGKEIASYINSFFNEQFELQNVNVEFSDKFQRMSVVDVKSRIVPVFVNLLNNALYWVGLSEYRIIKIGIINDLVIIANNGPAVDVDDVDKLFQLFYSRRPNGNGVGLYLSKQNLAVARHRIWYAMEPEQKLIKDGANFVIQFKGMEIK